MELGLGGIAGKDLGLEDVLPYSPLRYYLTFQKHVFMCDGLLK